MFDVGVRVKKAPLKGGELIRRFIREKLSFLVVPEVLE